jgi:hypothetical protein
MPKFSDKAKRKPRKVAGSASACATSPTELSRMDGDQMTTTADLQRNRGRYDERRGTGRCQDRRFDGRSGIPGTVGSRTGAVPHRLPLAVSAVSSFVPV